MEPLAPASYPRRVTAVVTVSGTVYGNFLLEKGEGFTIGRSLQTDLSIDDLRISRRHCRIQHEERGVTATDLRSANGTYLNGQRIQKVLLRQGDRLQLGNAELEFSVSYTNEDPLDQSYTCERCKREISLMTFAEGQVIQVEERFICPQCREKESTPEYTLVELDMIKRLRQEGFEVLEKLSISGIVPIYKARKTSLDQLVALKALPLSNMVSRKKISRFAQEAKAQARLRHPNVVAIYDVRQCEELIYIVMELIEGETLLQMVERSGSRLAVKDALRVTYQISKALAHAHEKGIVHRDVKPSNIMICPDGTAKLIDFGLAKNLFEVTSGITSDGETLGTLGYMAPEQLKTAKLADYRADIYGLGATLYHCLAGRPPFLATTESGLFEDIANGPPLDKLLGVPLNVVSLIVRMMQRNPDDRFQNLADVQAAIEQLVTEMTGIAADSTNVEFLLKCREEESDLLQTWRVKGRRPTSSFLGSFRESELIEFMQMLEFNQKTGVLNVATQKVRGRMVIAQGRIVRAEAGRVRGPAAVEALVGQPSGDFEFTPGEVLEARECDLNISRALLNAMRHRDEGRRS
ncbi:MAG: FHA domain-containing protein [Planctomycetota bacterium]|nr:MAG: FHA domain-containing protein [Planctomycetota bacterium]